MLGLRNPSWPFSREIMFFIFVHQFPLWLALGTFVLKYHSFAICALPCAHCPCCGLLGGVQDVPGNHAQCDQLESSGR